MVINVGSGTVHSVLIRPTWLPLAPITMHACGSCTVSKSFANTMVTIVVLFVLRLMITRRLVNSSTNDVIEMNEMKWTWFSVGVLDGIGYLGVR